MKDSNSDAFACRSPSYEAWYATRQGRRAELVETRLLDWALARFLDHGVVVDVGCGTGHFTRWLAAQELAVIGLDLSAAMLGEARRLSPQAALVQADAHRLPLRTASVDCAVFVTSLEFMDRPLVALAEAARVARRGIAVVALNRWSRGGLSRRFGRARESPTLGRARDTTLGALRRDLTAAAGARLETIFWTSGLFPGAFWRARAPVAVGGDVLCVAASLRREA